MGCSVSFFLEAFGSTGVIAETQVSTGHHLEIWQQYESHPLVAFIEILCTALIQPCGLNYPLEGYRVSCFNYFISCEYHPPIKDIFILLFNVLLKQGTLFCQHNQVTKKSLHKLIQLLAKITFLQPMWTHLNKLNYNLNISEY